MHVRPQAPDGAPVDYLGSGWAARALWVVENDPEVRAAVASTEVALAVAIEDAPPGRAETLFVRFSGGGLAAWHFGAAPVPADLGEPDFTLRGPYAAFAQVQQGHTTGRKALLSGQLRLEGGMLAAMRHMRALEAITGALARIPCIT